jgi:hypothetical protein
MRCITRIRRLANCAGRVCRWRRSGRKR